MDRILGGPGGVVGGLGPVDHSGVGWGLRLVLGVMGRTVEGGSGGTLGPRRSGGSSVILLRVEIQKPTERAV